MSNWRIYAIEAALLGSFMVSACVFATLINHPDSPVSRWIHSPLARRAIVGVAMGLTAIVLIYSPWGRRSGAHMNPAMTLSTLRLGRIKAGDAVLYVAAQFVGGAAGVGLMSILIRAWVAHPSVKYVATIPGTSGLVAAWVAEFAITFTLMSVVMAANRSQRLSRFTGCVAAAMVALYITFEAPLSGMSMNPARTFGSAVIGNVWYGWWIYFTAPVLGMLAAVEVNRLLSAAACGKLTHSEGCFIKCNCHQHSRNS